MPEMFYNHRNMRKIAAAGAITMALSAPSLSQMASPSNLDPASADVRRDLSILIRDNNNDIAGGDLFARQFRFQRGTILVVRAENEKCFDDLCPTFLISQIEKVSKIVLVSWLPKKVSADDRMLQLCSSCDELYGFTFVDKMDRSFAIWLSNDYTVLFRDALKGK